MCEKCLYRNNCQFLAKHKPSKVNGCTAFKSKTDLKTELAKEILEEIEGNADLLFDGYRNILVITEKDFCKIQDKYCGEGEKRPEIVKDSEHRCYYCQEIIPQGRDVCPICEKKR